MVLCMTLIEALQYDAAYEDGWSAAPPEGEPVGWLFTEAEEETKRTGDEWIPVFKWCSEDEVEPF
jgi:hypothetical protein